MTSPMERTLKELKSMGIKNQIVERYFPRSKKYPFGCKQDFLNIIDLLALDNGVVGIQVCGEDYQEHISKITIGEKENTLEWLKQPGTRLEIWGWRRVKKVRGKKAMEWKPRISDVMVVGGEIYIEERNK